MSKVCREDVNLCVEVNRIKFAFCPGFFQISSGFTQHNDFFFAVTTIGYNRKKIIL